MKLSVTTEARIVTDTGWGNTTPHTDNTHWSEPISSMVKLHTGIGQSNWSAFTKGTTRHASRLCPAQPSEWLVGDGQVYNKCWLVQAIQELFDSLTTGLETCYG